MTKSLPLILFLLLFYLSYAEDYKIFKITYKVEVQSAKGNLNLWIPLPRKDRIQKILKEKIETSYSYQIKTDEFRNRILYISVENPENFSVVIKAIIKRFKADKNHRNIDRTLAKEALRERRYIPISPNIRDLALSVIKNEKSTYEKAKLLYFHTLEKLDYDKSVPGWGRGDFYYASKVCKGNCTDFHTYFITLLRNIGIPAIFEIGFPIDRDKKKGSVKGYHCWASFWDGREWIPVDISEADKRPSLREFYFGNLDPYRISFTVGRDLILSPPQKAKPLNYFIYPYAELNGKSFKKVKWKLSYEAVL